MILYGAGGHAKAIISSLHANGLKVDIIFDDAPEIYKPGLQIIRKKYDPLLFLHESLIISIGDNTIRRKIARQILHPFGQSIHPSAMVEEHVLIDVGTVILHRCVVQKDVQIGKHVIVNTGAIVEHDCIIGDFVHLAPGSVLCGNVQIGENTLIGAGSVVTPNIKIGKNCIVSAGSVITKDIPDGAIVRGNPAKIINNHHVPDKKIWLSSPHMGGNELKYVCDAFETNWIAPLGPNIDAFEKQLSVYTKSKCVTALSSGTAAIHLALITLGIAPGDVILCQSLTFAASANPISYLMATPVFIDSEPETWNICPNALEDAIKHYIRKGKKPKAVIGVHLYGMPIKLTEILEICNKYAIPFIEDAAEALGSKYRNKPVGSFGKLGILSFNGNKIITASAGGALMSDNPELINQAKFLSAQAKDEAPHYEHSQIGYNYRMSNVCAGIGLGQLELIDQRVAQRRSNFDFYQDQLKDLPGITFQNEPNDCFSNRWLTAMLINPEVSGGVTRETIRQALDKNNIESRPLWKPMHLQPVYSDASYFGGHVSESLYNEGLCLPSGSNLTPDNLQSVVDCIKTLF